MYVRDITIGEIADAILQIDFYYEEGPRGPERPLVRNINLRGVACRKAKYALYARGFEGAPIRDIHLENCRFENVAEANIIENVQGLALNGVTINGKSTNA